MLSQGLDHCFAGGIKPPALHSPTPRVKQYLVSDAEPQDWLIAEQVGAHRQLFTL